MRILLFGGLRTRCLLVKFLHYSLPRDARTEILLPAVAIARHAHGSSQKLSGEPCLHYVSTSSTGKWFKEEHHSCQRITHQRKPVDVTGEMCIPAPGLAGMAMNFSDPVFVPWPRLPISAPAQFPCKLSLHAGANPAFGGYGGAARSS